MKKGDITPIQVPGMRRKVYDVNELRSLVQLLEEAKPLKNKPGPRRPTADRAQKRRGMECRNDESTAKSK